MVQRREYIFRFFWSPEGRMLSAVVATTYKKALRHFKQEHKEHAKFMGEVYHTVEPNPYQEANKLIFNPY